MENLSLNDQHPPGPPDPQNGGPPPVFAGQPPQGAPQLPPQMFTTAAQLLDLTDKKLMLVLRDGRKLLGVLRSWDQFANLVLTDTRERYFVTVPDEGGEKRLFCDIPRETYLVRGENVLLIGEVDLDKDDDLPPGYEEGKVEEVFAIARDAEQSRKKKDKVKARRVGELWGGEMEGSGEVLF
jgi:U6 snRNA-associated Sm-like protein LSm1